MNLFLVAVLLTPPPFYGHLSYMAFGGISVLFHCSMLKKEVTVSHWCIVHTLHSVTLQSGDIVESSVRKLSHSLISHPPPPAFHFANFIRLLNHFKSFSDPFLLQVITSVSNTTEQCFHYISLPWMKIYWGVWFFFFVFFFNLAFCWLKPLSSLSPPLLWFSNPADN